MAVRRKTGANEGGWLCLLLLVGERDRGLPAWAGRGAGRGAGCCGVVFEHGEGCCGQNLGLWEEDVVLTNFSSRCLD